MPVDLEVEIILKIARLNIDTPRISADSFYTILSKNVSPSFMFAVQVTCKEM
jgi:hypothetical protein